MNLFLKMENYYLAMNIKELKKELGISNKDIAELFGLSVSVYANSTAKKRYENALIKFYKIMKKKGLGLLLLIGLFAC